MESPNSEDSFEEKVTSKRTRNRSKVTAEWSESNIRKLISAVELNECLWNANHADYKNRNKRNRAWAHMSEDDFDSKHDGGELNSKWSNLRIQFKSYWAKSKKKKSGQGTDDNKVSWKYFDQMAFVAAAEAKQSTPTESTLVSKTIHFAINI